MLGWIILTGVLGGMVGLKCEFADEPAGLRTHMLVGATAVFLVMMAFLAVASRMRRPISEPIRYRLLKRLWWASAF
jgi:uncharacterized membrane protein YhiD involved in acid resistance